MVINKEMIIIDLNVSNNNNKLNLHLDLLNVVKILNKKKINLKFIIEMRINKN